MRKSGRFAWVEFASLAVSQQALALDGESLGAGVMKVSQSKTPIHTAGWRAAVCPVPALLQCSRAWRHVFPGVVRVFQSRALILTARKGAPFPPFLHCYSALEHGGVYLRGS